MDNYRMLAEHFGRNGKVRVIVTGTEAKTDAQAPIELQLPEGMSIDQGLLDEFKAVASDAKLTAAERGILGGNTGERLKNWKALAEGRTP